MAASSGNPQLYFRLKPEDRAWVCKYAESTGRTKTDVLKEALELYRKERDRETSNLS